MMEGWTSWWEAYTESTAASFHLDQDQDVFGALNRNDQCLIWCTFLYWSSSTFSGYASNKLLVHIFVIFFFRAAFVYCKQTLTETEKPSHFLFLKIVKEKWWLSCFIAVVACCKTFWKCNKLTQLCNYSWLIAWIQTCCSQLWFPMNFHYAS